MNEDTGTYNRDSATELRQIAVSTSPVLRPLTLHPSRQGCEKSLPSCSPSYFASRCFGYLTTFL